MVEWYRAFFGKVAEAWLSFPLLTENPTSTLSVACKVIKYMGSYKITKIVITVVYSLILIYALTRLNTTTTVRMESKCANPS